MGEPDVPKAVQRFIAQRIDSVAQLEALLVVRAAPERLWNADDVARALVTRPEHAGALLGGLAGTGVLTIDGDAYRYAPEPALARDVDAVADAYATRRPTLIGLIFAPRDTDVTALADAFRVRRDGT